MQQILKKIILKVLSPILSELSAIKFIVGQSAILASRSNSDNFRDLWDAEIKVYSQWGEDGIIDFLCEKLNISKPKVLEVGSGNFSECNSRFLAENRNASVVAVDLRKDLTEFIDASPLKWTNNIFPLEELVTPENVNEIISIANKKIGLIDIFSLDIDGNDYWVLDAADLSQFKIIIAEYNPIFGSSRAVSIPREDNFDRTKKHSSFLYFGASLSAFIYRLSNQDFVFIGTNRVGNNAFFVKSKNINQIGLPQPRNLSEYTDWRVRESRDSNGKLNYLSLKDGAQEIKNLPLVDVTDYSQLTVQDLNPR